MTQQQEGHKTRLVHAALVAPAGHDPSLPAANKPKMQVNALQADPVVTL